MTFEGACAQVGGQHIWSVGEALLFAAGLVAIVSVAAALLILFLEWVTR